MTGARRGFTLVELLVVLVIIGMVAAVVVPALRSRGGAAAAAKELVTLYETTRELAISRGAPAVAVLDLSNGSYRVLGAETLGRPADTLRRGSLALPSDARLASRARRGAAVARMSFDALGRARGDDVVITDGGGRHEVITDPWTGASHVQAAP